MADPSSRWSASRLTSGAASRRGARAFGLLASALLSLAAVACQSTPDYQKPPSGGTGGQHTGSSTAGPGTGGSTGSGVVSGNCDTEGETRPCHEIIGKHAGIVNCFNGTQTCDRGVWGLCEDGNFSLKFVGPRPGSKDERAPQPESVEAEPAARADLNLHPLQAAAFEAGQGQLELPSIATDTLCMDPCDPTCHSFLDGNSHTITGQTLLVWASATATSLASNKASLLGGPAWKEPCAIGTDCQFGMYCKDPVTKNVGSAAGQCAHDKCAVGTALDPTCPDPCVSLVCAANSNCCTYGGTCAHAPCVTGNVLACQATDTCVSTLCGTPATAHCCDAAHPTTPGWDAACVTAYGACTGTTCPLDPVNRAWDSKLQDPAVGSQACTQLVHDLCGLTCPNTTPICDHSLCALGSGLTAGCDNPGTCVTSVCASNPACCGTTGSWTQACIDLMPQVCGKYCKAPPLKGVCTAYLPNEVDLGCNGPDLVATVPCFDQLGGANAASTIPTGSCAIDSDCGSPTSGIICDTSTATHICRSGCRGTGGNGCPSPQTCNSATAAAGTCQGFKVPGNATAQGYVVICNNGTQPTPSGAPVVVNVYPSGTMAAATQLSQPPTTSPKASCSTANLNPASPQLLPGKCIDLPCTTTKGDEIFINPPTANAPNAGTAQVAECGVANHTWDVYANNWSVNIDTTTSNQVGCDAPLCALANGALKSLPTHLLIEMESSAALVSLPVGEWFGITQGVGTFLNSFGNTPLLNSGASVELGLYPDNSTTCNTAHCGSTGSCVKTTPGWLPVAGAANAANITTLKNAMPVSANGGNPPFVLALTNALAAAAADASAGAGAWNDAVVMIIGSPITGTNSCSSSATDMAGVASQYFKQYGVRTHVIALGTGGLPSSQLTDAQTIAAAGGGQATYIQVPLIALTLSTNIASALTNLFTYSDPACIYALPSTTLFDASNTQVKFFSPSAPSGWNFSVQVPIPQVTNPANLSTFLANGQTYLDACLAACGSGNDGWCYDSPTAPTKVVLCPHTCTAVVTDPYPANLSGAHGTGNYNLACPSYYAPASPVGGVFPGACSVPGTKPLWSYLAYTTVEPTTGTNVDFAIQTGMMVGGMCPDPVVTPTAYASVGADVIAQTDPTVTSPGAGCSINGGTMTCTASLQCESAAHGGSCVGGQCVCTKASQCVTGNCDATGHCACPVDLVQKYNGGLINGPMLADCLNLNVSINADGTHTNSPTLTSFELRYSCPFTE